MKKIQFVFWFVNVTHNNKCENLFLKYSRKNIERISYCVNIYVTQPYHSKQKTMSNRWLNKINRMEPPVRKKDFDNLPQYAIKKSIFL